MALASVTGAASAAFNHAREGMNLAERRFAKAAAKIADDPSDANSIVDLIVSERTYQANAVVVRTQDDMIGSLLDRRG